jgi:hypothetical protein
VVDVVTEDLVAEVGGGIDEGVMVLAVGRGVRKHGAGPIASVAWIIGGADFASASDHGDAGGGSGA